MAPSSFLCLCHCGSTRGHLMTVVLVVYPATGPGFSSPTRVAEIYYLQTCSRSDTITTSGCNVFLFYCQQTTVWLPNEHLASVPNGRGLPDFDSTHSSFVQPQCWMDLIRFLTALSTFVFLGNSQFWLPKGRGSRVAHELYPSRSCSPDGCMQNIRHARIPHTIVLRVQARSCTTLRQ